MTDSIARFCVCLSGVLRNLASYGITELLLRRMPVEFELIVVS